MKHYWTWFFSGEPSSGSIGRTVFLPIPPGEELEEGSNIFVGETSFQLQPGESFVLPMFVWIGERYAPELELDDDDPALPPREFFTNLRLWVTLDDRRIIDDRRDDLGDYYFDAQYFDDPLSYDTPTDYGAVAALWVKGVGMIQKPLSVGHHTLRLFVYSEDAGLGFHNTWHLTVAK